MFEGSKLKLRLWFRAIWWVLNQKHGVSAAGMQKGLGIKRYETTWLMLHKIRGAMIDPKRSKLSGNIEIDEAYIGGKKQGGSLNKAGTKRNPMVIVAVEFEAKRLGRIRIEKVESNSTANIIRFVGPNIEQDSHLHSDEWAGYTRLTTVGYQLTQTPSVAGLKRGDNVLPRVHLVISLLKNWLNGTHHGRVSPKHLQAYLDEFVFRFNRRTSTSRGLLFRRLLENAIYQPGPTYKELVATDKR